MNTFASRARSIANRNYVSTENGAVALGNTGSALLDIFARASSLRAETETTITSRFVEAIREDKLLATKLMFYIRNIRGGLGERKIFRTMLRWMGDTYPDIVAKNIEHVPFYGRWDDLYALVGTKAEGFLWEFIESVLWADNEAASENKPISLCAKWLKSTNASSKETCEMGKYTAKKLGFSESFYRKLLSSLRRQIKIVESQMSSQEWSEVEYSAVPSLAMKRYRNAFKNHDGERFSTFIKKVEKGEEKINAGTLYPYDILMAGHLKINRSWDYNYGSRKPREMFIFDNDPVLEAQWKALPNYVSGENNVLVMSDTSGSMEDDNGRPLATSVGLAIYFAERNKGAFKNLFLTFSAEPRFVELKGTTLAEKVGCIEPIVQNTNLELAMELILATAKTGNVPQEEMPKTLVVISDMQFDQGQSSLWCETLHEHLERKFAKAGYKMPVIVYWNVGEYAPTHQAEAHTDGTILVSGHSVSTFKSVLGNIGKTPYDFMLETLSSEQYERITI